MLEATLTADVDADSVQFALTVENTGTESETLSFSDSQRAEFVVHDGDDEVWRWSQGQMFAQMLGSETVDPGESVAYEGEWEAPLAGAYTVVGEVVATDCDIRAETTVTV